MDRDWSPADRHRILDEIRSRLWAFLQRNASEEHWPYVIEGLMQLARADVKKLAQLHFILDPLVTELVERLAPELFHHFAISTSGEAITSKVGPRGAVNWGRTIALRSRTYAAETVTWFECSFPERRYDLLENRMLKTLLTAIARTCTEWIVNPTDEPSDTRERWDDRVRRLWFDTSRLLRHPLLSGVSTMDRRETKEQAVFRSRFTRYHRLEPVWNLYRNLWLNPTLSALTTAVEQRVLVPQNDDVLFEVWALLHAGLVVENITTTVTFGLIGAGRQLVIMGSCQDGVRITIWYQGLPEELRMRSHYMAIMNEILPGSGNRPLRPDLVIQIQVPDGRTVHLVIEVKRTASSNTLRDGIAQLLQYIYDFDLYQEEHALPYGAVMTYAAGPRSQFTRDMLVCTADGFSEGFAHLLDKHLTQLRHLSK